MFTSGPNRLVLLIGYRPRHRCPLRLAAIANNISPPSFIVAPTLFRKQGEIGCYFWLILWSGSFAQRAVAQMSNDELLTDDYVAGLLAQDAKDCSLKYSAMGMDAFRDNKK